MKKLFFLLPFAAMLGFASCENEADDADATDNDTAVVIDEPDNTVVIRERETYRTNLRREIDSLQMRLDSFGNRTEAKSRKGWQEAKTDIQRRIDRAEAELDALGNRADNEWDQFKTNLDREMDTLRREWDSLDIDIDKKNKK